jgi:pSer/pThr/pTyr-binding forkhead associated (FHA) protein
VAELPPWDKKPKPVPVQSKPGAAGIKTDPRTKDPVGPKRPPDSPLLEDASGPQSTVFVGAPTRPKQDESSVLLLATKVAYLAATAGPGKGRQWQLRSEKVLLGREQPAEVIVDDPAASRRHAQVYKKNGRWFLKDLDSTNGTYLDGPLRGTERILWDGDVFRIGDWEITFSDPSSARK